MSDAVKSQYLGDGQSGAIGVHGGASDESLAEELTLRMDLDEGVHALAKLLE